MDVRCGSRGGVGAGEPPLRWTLDGGGLPMMEGGARPKTQGKRRRGAPAQRRAGGGNSDQRQRREGAEGAREGARHPAPRRESAERRKRAREPARPDRNTLDVRCGSRGGAGAGEPPHLLVLVVSGVFFLFIVLYGGKIRSI